MPTPTWDLALAELVFFLPTLIPSIYCLWKHVRTGLGGWIFLIAFVILQVVGAGMIVSAGENATPAQIPSTAVITTNVGLSSLLLGTSGIVHQYTKLSGYLKTRKAERFAIAYSILYHFLAVAAIAIYAIGASNAQDPSSKSNSKTLWEVGILLILLLWILLDVVFVFIVRSTGIRASTALFWAITISLALLGIRVVYQTVATFNGDKGA